MSSPASSSTSPTEAAPSTAGGGGKGLQDCLAFWDRDTHMTKAEWKASCERTLNRLTELSLSLETLPTPSTPKSKP